MSKKKNRSVPVAPPKQEKKMVIDMNRMNLKKEHTVPGFRTGAHQTIKDRPRKKDWKREYEKGREPGRYNTDTNAGSFFSPGQRKIIAGVSVCVKQNNAPGMGPVAKLVTSLV